MKRRFRTIALFICVFLTVSNIERSAGGAPSVQRLVLPNQLVILLSEEHSLPFVTFSLMIDAGSWRDPPGKGGLANLTARSLSLGTERYDVATLNAELDFMGTELDSSCERDYAAFGFRVLREHLEKGFDLFWDVITRPTFPADEIGKEVEKIAGAIQSSEDQPMRVAEKAFFKALFPTNPYGHPVEGTQESVPLLTREAVIGFYANYYSPSSGILAIVGDITLDEVQKKLVPKLRQWPHRQTPPEPFDDSFAKGPQVVKIDRPITQANIILGHAGVSRSNPDYYSISVMNYILGGGGFGSRLFDEIRIKRGLAYSVTSHFLPQKHPGAFQVTIQTKNSSAREAISIAVAQMKLIQSEPVSDQELEMARKFLVGSFPLRFDTQADLARFITQVEYHGLGLDYPEKYPSLIGRITKEDVLRVAKKYLHPEDYILTIVADLKETGMQ